MNQELETLRQVVRKLGQHVEHLRQSKWNDWNKEPEDAWHPLHDSWTYKAWADSRDERYKEIADEMQSILEPIGGRITTEEQTTNG